MKTIHLALVFAATLVVVWPVKSADTNSIAGVYILETVNGEKLSAAVTHEGNPLKIRSGAFTIKERVGPRILALSAFPFIAPSLPLEKVPVLEL